MKYKIQIDQYMYFNAGSVNYSGPSILQLFILRPPWL